MDVLGVLGLINAGANVVMPLVDQINQLRKNKNVDEYVVALEATVTNELNTLKKQLRALKIALIVTGATLCAAIIAIAILAFVL